MADRKRAGHTGGSGAAFTGGRGLALRVLLRLGKDEAVQSALDQVLSAAQQGRAVERRDGALCTELVYGYLRTEIRLQHIVSTVMSNPQGLPPEVRLVLGLGVYALLFLQRVPAHATLSWSVDHVHARFGKRMGGLVNAVLRSVQRLGDAPLHEDFYARAGQSRLEALSLFYAMPLWIAKLWAESSGEKQCENLLRRSMAQPRACLRLNGLHAEYATLRAALLEQGGEIFGAQGILFDGGSLPQEVAGKALQDWHDQGVFSWQAAGSLAVLDVCAPLLGEDSYLWDACAGQGGKSLALVERGVSVSLCSDVSLSRLRHLRHTAQRLGLSSPPMARMSAENPAFRQWPGDIVLDVPCSGLGTLARRPEIRRRRSEEHVRALAALQGRILAATWACLQPGRHLLYMTCTLNPQENEEQVAAFVSTAGRAEVLRQWQTPNDHPWLEGMYVAVVQKSGA